VRAPEVAIMIQRSKRRAWEVMRKGELPSQHKGGAVFTTVGAVRRYLQLRDAHPTSGTAHPPQLLRPRVAEAVPTAEELLQAHRAAAATSERLHQRLDDRLMAMEPAVRNLYLRQFLRGIESAPQDDEVA